MGFQISSDELLEIPRFNTEVSMRRVFLSSLIALFGFVAQSHAEITFGFAASPAGGPGEVFWTPPSTPDGGSAVFQVDPGDSIRISIFLLERGGDTRLSQEGLFQIGLQANFDPALGEVSRVIGALPLESPTSPFPVYRFDQLYDAPSFDNGAGTVTMLGAIPPTDFSDDIVPGKRTGSTFLGFFDYQLNVAGTANITFSDPVTSGLNSENNLLALKTGPGPDDPLVNLDPELFSNGGVSTSMVTITAIPEPSSVMLLSGACGIVLLRRRRR